MKRIVNAKWILIAILLYSLTTTDASAQYKRGTYLYITTDNVCVRRSPSKNAPVLSYVDDCDLYYKKPTRVKAKFKKGTGVCHYEYGIFIVSLGKTRNGFLRVECIGNGCPMARFTGWIPVRYLKPVCSECGGEPENYRGRYDGIQCPKCHGRGY